MRGLFPYLWPRDWRSARCASCSSLAFLVVAKTVNVYVPLLYKHAVDALTPGGARPSRCRSRSIVAYGVARVCAQALRRAARRGLRQGRAARGPAASRSRPSAISMRCRCASIWSARPAACRAPSSAASAASSSCSRYLLFNVVPTLFEILLVCGILWRLYDWRASRWSTLATIVAYIVFTFALTEWRIKFRREMNERDSEANTKAIDSLLNFETVKYFANEEHEARALRRGAARLRDAPRSRARRTLSAAQYRPGHRSSPPGLVAVMLLAAQGVAARHHDASAISCWSTPI